MNRVVNNQEQVSQELNQRFNVQSVFDDGNVFVNNVSEELSEQIVNWFGSRRVGDGVQSGSLWVNGNEV